MKFKIIPNEQTPRCTEDLILDQDMKLLEKFYSFARRQHNCAGLASNQVSCDGKRIMKRFFAIKDGHFWDIIINPSIVKYKGESKKKVEGCLTWLGKHIIALRYPTIEVSYFNLKGEHVEETISGFKAQVWQHEYNHLLGVKEEVHYNINNVKVQE